MLRDRYPSCLSVTFVYCGQTVEWIKMSLGTEVDLGPGDIVLDADPASPQGKGHNSIPTFQPMSIVAKRSPISATAELLFHFKRRVVLPTNTQNTFKLFITWSQLKHPSFAKQTIVDLCDRQNLQREHSLLPSVKAIFRYTILIADCSELEFGLSHTI